MATGTTRRTAVRAVVSYYTDTADRYAPQHIVEKSPFYDVQHCLSAWPIYCAMLSVITKVHPAIVFRTLLPLLEIPTVYYIAYLLLRAFFPQNRKKAELALIFYYDFCDWRQGRKNVWCQQRVVAGREYLDR